MGYVGVVFSNWALLLVCREQAIVLSRASIVWGFYETHLVTNSIGCNPVLALEPGFVARDAQFKLCTLHYLET